MQWRDALRRRLSGQGNVISIGAWTSTPAVRDGRSLVAEMERTAGAEAVDDLAKALGLALSGRRVWVSPGDAARTRELVAEAVDRHAPVVVHLDGPDVHESVERLDGTGALVLFARCVQEAADMTVIARRVAERALVPAVVAMDRMAVAESFQDVSLPPEDAVREFVGEPSTLIPAPTPAQEMLFGKSRRLVPRWFDPALPALHGATLDPTSQCAARGARTPYFLDTVPTLLAEETRLFAERTGRRLDAASDFAVEDADRVLVAQGALVEHAESIARQLRDKEGLRVGVIGIRCRQPFPRGRVAELLADRGMIAVLESGDLPYEDDSSLARQVRNAGAPHVVTAVCGLGGAPTRAADLAEYCRRADPPARQYLGLDFLPPSTIDPKRQVLLDRLRRTYPDIQMRGLRSETPYHTQGDERPLLISGYDAAADSPLRALFADAADLLHRSMEWPVRTECDGPNSFRLSVGPNAGMPGVDAQPDVALVMLDADPSAIGGPHALEAALNSLAPRGTLIVAGERGVERRVARMPFALQRIVRTRDVRISALRVGGVASPGELCDRLLGALTATLGEWVRGLDETRALAAREAALAPAAEEERAARLEAFRFGGRNMSSLDPNEIFEPTAAVAGPVEPEAPLSTRHLARTDERWDSLPRFWDQTGVLYREGRVSQIAPDPYMGLRSMPPLSSAFRQRSAEYESLPELDAALCIGCGDCWTACPDGAIAARALTARALLDVSVKLASDHGANVSQLRPLVSKLAPAIDAAFADEDPPRTFDEAARAALTNVLARTRPPADRRRALAEAMDAVLVATGCLQLAKTAPFHDGTANGELLTLAIDPHVCQGCASCVAVCPTEALAARTITPDRARVARDRSRAAVAFPDVAPATMARAAEHPDVGPAASVLLSERFRGTFVGGSGAEPGSGAQLALRLVLAAVESGRAEVHDDLAGGLAELQERFAEAIRTGLLHGVPTDDLDAISSGLRVLGRRDVEVADLVGRLEDACGSERVDGARLGRLVDAATEVANLVHRLDRSHRGALGTVLSGEDLAGWAASFPYNPFAGPVLVDRAGEALALAHGLAEAAAQDTVAAVRVRRHAEHVLKHEHPGVPVELPTTWDELTDAERLLCPPLVVVMDAEAWGRARLADVGRLLEGSLPVLILALSSTEEAADATGRLAPAGVVPLQSTVAHADHLMTGVAAAAAEGRPSWVHVFGPDPAHAGIAADGARAEALRVVEAGRFTLSDVAPVAPAAVAADAAAAVDATAAGLSASDVAAGDARARGAVAEEVQSAEGATRDEMSRRLTRRLMTLAGFEDRSGDAD